jgi:hypothetical protein
MRDQLVNETIDARILRLVGLEDVFDLDYETYLVLLKEAQVKGKNTIPAEEQAILANERKRIRGKVGRFKVKSKTIRAENITSVRSIGQKLLPAAKGVGAEPPIVKSLLAISKTVESISISLTDQSKEESKEAEENRKEEENKKRAKREETLESSAKKVMAAAKKLFAPVKGIFDSIFNFFFYTLLGKGVTTALEWFANPANKEKISALGKFVKDWWPTLLGTAALFLTPLGGFIRTTLGLITNLAFRFPLVAAAAGASVAGEIGDKKLREMTGTGYSTAMIGSTPTPFGAPKVKTKPKTEKEIKENQEAPYGRNPDGTPKLFPSLFTSGGLIDSNTGTRISGAGPDTQLTALQPGEVVMNRSTVRAVGANNLLALNGMFGGPNANKPKFAGNIQFSQNGGMVGRFMNWWNRGRNVQVPNENTARWGGLRQYTSKNPNPQTLFGNDRLQNMISDQAFKTQQKPGLKNWRPWRGFVDERELFKMMRGKPGDPFKFTRTGPTPAIRQAVERPLRSPSVRGGLGLTAGIELGTNIFAPLAVSIAAQRRQAQEQRYTSMMLGNTSVSGKSASVVPTPNSRSRIITLPPTIVPASTPGAMAAAGTEIPSFSAIAPGNRRSDNAQIYGLIP